MISIKYFTVVALACLLGACTTDRIAKETTAVNVVTQKAVAATFKDVGIPISKDTTGTSSSAQNLASQALAVKEQKTIKTSSSAWYGNRVVASMSTALLPQIFKEKIHIDFSGEKDKRVSLAFVAEKLSSITSVPVRIAQDVYPKTTTANQAPLTTPIATALMPIGAKPLAQIKPSDKAIMPIQPISIGESVQNLSELPTVSMRWDSSLEGYLDHITNLTNLSWNFRDGVVLIERFATEVFTIDSMGGSQSYKMSLGGDSKGSSTNFGTANESMDVSEEGKSNSAEELKASLEMLVKPTGGSVSFNETSGRIIVVTTKDVMSRVRLIIRNETEISRRQALVQIDVYSVIKNADESYGVNWTGFINDLAGTWSSAISSPASLVPLGAASLGYTLLKEIPSTSTQLQKNTATRYGGSKVLLEALHNLGDSATHKPISFLAKNREWTRKSSLITTGYLAETTSGTSNATGAGVPGLKAGTVTTGDKILVKPAIHDDGSIELKVGISMTELNGLFTASSGVQSIQTPEVSGTGDQATFRLEAGEAVVITGLTRIVSKANRSGLSEDIPIVMGGSEKKSVRREHFLVVVRATKTR